MAGDRTVRITILGDDRSGSSALQKLGGVAGTVETKLSGFGKALSGLGGVATVAFGMIAAQGIQALGGALSGLIGDAQESAAVAAQLAAVLKSTGGAAGLTADDVTTLADKLSALTGIDDEAIVSAQSVLLTFTNIGKDVFPDTTQAVLDLSVAMGGDMQGAAVQVGKALNDPIAGISALTRVGVTFTDQQKDQIKAMVEAGDVAGAQRLILAELAKEFGGSAEAQATNVKKLSVAWGNFREALGGAILPIIEKVAGALNTLLRSDAAQAWIERLTSGIGGAMNWVGANLPAFIAGFQRVWGVIQQVGGAFGALGEAIMALASGQINLGQFIGGLEIWITSIRTKLADLAQLAAPYIGAFFSAIGSAIQQWAPQVAAQFGQWALSFVDWIQTTAIPWVLPRLEAFGQAVVGWLQTTAIPAIVSAAVGLATAVTDWVQTTAIPYLQANLPLWGAALWGWITGTAVPAVVAAVTDLATALGGWITSTAIPYLQTNLPLWLAALGDWLTGTAIPAATAFLVPLAQAWGTWVMQAITYLLENLPRWYIALEGWLFGTAYPAIVAKLIEFGKAFGSWVVTTAVPYLLENIPKWNEAIVSFLLNVALPAIKAKGLEIGQSLVDAFMEEAGKIVARISATMGEVPGAITSGLGDLGGLLVGAGASLIQGLLDGISSKIGELRNLLGSITNMLPDWKGPESKDRKILYPSGQWVMQGFADGLLAGAKEVMGTLATITDALVGGHIGAPIPGVNPVTGQPYSLPPGGGGGHVGAPIPGVNPVTGQPNAPFSATGFLGGLPPLLGGAGFGAPEIGAAIGTAVKDALGNAFGPPVVGAAINAGVKDALTNAFGPPIVDGAITDAVTRAFGGPAPGGATAPGTAGGGATGGGMADVVSRLDTIIALIRAATAGGGDMTAIAEGIAGVILGGLAAGPQFTTVAQPAGGGWR